MSEDDLSTVLSKVADWGDERDLHDDPGAQFEKLGEEFGELARAHANLVHGLMFLKQGGYDKEDHASHREVKDAIGDMAVVLEQLARGHGLTLEDCIRHAWEEIEDRDGETIDGKFVKEGDE